MKVRLPLALLSSLLASVPALVSADTTATADLGTVMFVGDSITHGVDTGSYRWALHKILVDNGISYSSVGVKTGNYSNGVTAGTIYGGVAFNNEHSAQYNVRAYQISGRNTSTSYFDGYSISEWLDGTATGTSYTPDTFFLMIGTNDLLSVYQNNLSANIETATAALLGALNEDGTRDGTGDMDTIVKAMLTANENATIYVMSIPCWTTHRFANSEANHQAVVTYNEALEAWADSYDNVTYIDINTGLIDVASSTSFYGVESMFRNAGTSSTSDGFHPTAQGDLIIAGNLAKALGYAGRSAGQTRKGAESLSVNFHNDAGAVSWTTDSLTNAGFTLDNVTVGTTDSGSSTLDLSAEGTSSITYSWAEGTDLSNGFTLDFNLVLGDGDDDSTWDTTTNFSVTLGSDEFYGTLNINEAYIQWGDTILYSMDMSTNTENLRVAYVLGNSLEGLDGGYYVWLGDMLIGEALSSTSGEGYSGLTITYSGTGTATLSELALDGTASYAPTTTGLVNESTAYYATSATVATAAAEGNLDWDSAFASVSTGTIESSTSATINARESAGFESGDANITLEGFTTYDKNSGGNFVYANSGTYTGDVGLTITGGYISAGWYGAHGAGGTLTGDAYLRFTGDAEGGSTVFGAVNSTKVTGNVYLEFSAANAAFDVSFTSSGTSSVVGSYATNIDGNVDIVVNSGSFTYQIMGGIHSGGSGSKYTIGGDTNVYINGGTIGSSTTAANVMGGGLTGTISGSTNVTVTGGTIYGNVYGGGTGGTIGTATSEASTVALTSGVTAVTGSDDSTASSVSIKGGTVTGNVLGAGTGGTINGDSSVTISGGLVQGTIYGGGTGGTINGDTSVTIVGNTAQLYGSSGYVDIYGAGSATVTGNSTVTIQNLSSGNTAFGFDKYTGTINGGYSSLSDGKTATLVLDNVTVSSFGAELTEFTNVTATNGTDTTLSSLGGASTVTIDAGCSLTVSGDVSTLATLTLGEGASLTLSLEGALSLTDALTVDVSDATTYALVLDLGETSYESTEEATAGLTSLLSSISFTTSSSEETSATADAKVLSVDTETNTVTLVAANYVGNVSEPTTASLSILGLGALLLRRRRGH